MSRYQLWPTVNGIQLVDSADGDRAIARAMTDARAADRIMRLLNDLDEEVKFLRAACRNQGLEIRPARRAS